MCFFMCLLNVNVNVTLFCHYVNWHPLAETTEPLKSLFQPFCASVLVSVIGFIQSVSNSHIKPYLLHGRMPKFETFIGF